MGEELLEIQWKFNWKYKVRRTNKNTLAILENGKRNFSLFDWWEKGKSKIKDISLSFSKMQAQKERVEFDWLYIELELEEGRQDTDILTINDLRDRIITLENMKNKDILIRSRLEFYEDDYSNMELF